jgi:hypothetical protein
MVAPIRACSLSTSSWEISACGTTRRQASGRLRPSGRLRRRVRGFAPRSS